MKYIVVWHNLKNGYHYGVQGFDLEEDAIEYCNRMKMSGNVVIVVYGRIV